MQNDRHAQRPGFRPDVEGLRGVAILGVVAYHVGVPGAAGGYVGVDVFFVLSGFLITQILLREWNQRGAIDLWTFYARRMRRLLPAAFVTILVTLSLAWLLLSPLEVEGIARSARAASAYLSNVRFARQATDYLAHSARNDPFLHTWSLAVEEQFYLLWPLFLILTLRAFGRRDRALLAAIGITSAVSLALCIHLTIRAQPWAFFMVPTRWWEFGIGGLAAIASPRLAVVAGPRAVPLSVVALGAVILPFTLYGPDTRFPGIAAMVPGLGTAALLYAEVRRGPVSSLLRSTPFQRLGALSYSWYLWHWPVLVFCWTLYPEMPLAGRAAAAVLALGLAQASYRLVENPIRQAPLRVTPRFVVGVGMASTIALIGASTLSLRTGTATSERSPHRAFREAVITLPIVYGNGCMRNTMDRDLGRSCMFGEVGSPTRVVLFGDSHAAQWFPALEQVARSRGWELHVMVKTSCPVPDVAVYMPSLRRAYDECSEWRARAIEEIRLLRPALVVMASSNLYLDPDAFDGNPVSAEAWSTGLARTVAALAAGTDRIVVMRDNLHPGFDVPICHARQAWSPLWARDCTFARGEAMGRARARAEAAALSGLPSVEVIDLVSSICPGSTCPTIRGETVLYRDDNHLTPAFTIMLAADLGAALDAQLAAGGGAREPLVVTAGHRAPR